MRLLLLCLLALSSPLRALDLDQSEYVAFKSGDEWIFDAEITLPTGQVSKATTRRKVEDAVVRDGITYLRCREVLEGAPYPFQRTMLIRKDEHGVYSIADDGKRAQEQTELSLPMKPNNSWKMEAGGRLFTITVIALEAVTIGDKTYERCFHLRGESADGKYRQDFWNAPIVGTIKAEMYFGDQRKMSLLLREFKPGK